MKTATYILIKSSVLSVTSMVKPPNPGELHYPGLTLAEEIVSYEEGMKAFNESFIKVDNPEVLDKVERNSRIFRLRIDGLYPVEGIEFEVKWHNPCIGAKKCLIADDQNRNNCAQLHGNKCQKEYRVAVLTPLRQEPKPNPYFCGDEPRDGSLDNESITDSMRKKSKGEPGNEAKKDEARFTLKDIEEAYLAGVSWTGWYHHHGTEPQPPQLQEYLESLK